MELRGIRFGRINYAAGAGGFHCDGTEYHHHNKGFLDPDFSEYTNVVKTITLNARTTANGANMELDENLRPVELFPRCIAVNPFLCCSVNAAALPNEGTVAHLDRGVLQQWTRPFYLSLMSVATTREQRLQEWQMKYQILAERKKEFNAPFAVQQNMSCPNGGLDPKGLVEETIPCLDAGAILDAPKVVKFNVMHLSVESALEIEKHPEFDGLLISNTIPWYDLPLWVRLLSFGTPFSPLRWRGIKQDGGYAGPYLLHLVENKTRELRLAGFKKRIIVCGGITKPKHVNRICSAGGDAVEVATVTMIRPWRVGPIGQRANSLTWRK